MKLIITGKDFSLTPSVKAYVTEHAARLEHFNHRIVKVKFELDVDKRHQKGENCRVEGWVEIPGNDLQAGARATDMHTAINRVIDKLSRQLSKKKRRLINRRKQ